MFFFVEFFFFFEIFYFFLSGALRGALTQSEDGTVSETGGSEHIDATIDGTHGGTSRALMSSNNIQIDVSSQSSKSSFGNIDDIDSDAHAVIHPR